MITTSTLTLLSPCNMLECTILEQDSGCTTIQLPYSNIKGITPQEAFECRNAGAVEASTKWITFVDPLDTYNWDKHLALLASLETVAQDTSMILIPPKGFSLDGIEHALKLGQACPTGCITVRKDRFLELGGFNIEIPHSASWEFLVRYIKAYSVETAIQSSAHTWQYHYNRNSIANTMLPPHTEVMNWRREWLQTLFV